MVIFIPHVPFIIKNIVRGIHVRYNGLKTAIWPVPATGAMGAILSFSGWVLTRSPTSWWRSGWAATAIWNLQSSLPLVEYLPIPVRVAYLSFFIMVVILGLVVETQRAVLRLLLRYTSWLFDDPKKPSVITKLWYMVIKYCYVRASKPLLWSYQDGLPLLPVPPLKSTCEKLMKSLQPVLSDEEYAATEVKCKAFQANEGPKLQRYLHLQSWITKNYVSDWWLKFVYLRGRGSLLIHSNYYGCGDLWSMGPLTQNREARAASLAWQYIMRKQEIDHETLQPLRVNDVVPMCMDQYKFMFSTTRIPGMDTDHLQQYEPQDSRHLVVLYQGVFYRINVYTIDRKRLLTAYEIQLLLRSIVENPLKPESPTEGKLAALTTENRAKWAEVREVHFSRGLNKGSLDIIERAMFILVLDERSPSSLTEQSSWLLAGDGATRWCDKSICLVVFQNGRCGLHTEHSWGDAPVVSHITELCMAWELSAVKEGSLVFDAEGLIVAPKVTGPQKAIHQRLTAAQHLRWQMNADLELAINQAVQQAEANISDLDFRSEIFETINRGIMKGCRCPPDAFVQMGIQLAYYRLEQRFVPTYEPAMMRMWRNGRTETIRSCSTLSCNWVRAMEDPAVAKEQKAKLLRAACDDHQYRTKLSMAGQGIDRHLFALYVVSRGGDISSPFLDQIMGMKWTLSTSQVPWRQANKKEVPGVDWSNVMMSSGGFGPVDAEGYGCCYNFMDDQFLVMHISSRKSAPNTDSSKMMAALTGAYAQMAALFKE